MEKVYRRLFGEDIREQEGKIRKLFNWTLVMLAGMVILFFVSPSYGTAMIGVIFLMWGLPVVKATAKVNKVTELFNYNVAVFAIVIILWLCFGYLTGIVCFLMGIIRYIQIKKGSVK